jgi:hypothetical protein
MSNLFVQPIAKCLKTLADGDPYGVAESASYQRLALSNLPISGGFARSGMRQNV